MEIGGKQMKNNEKGITLIALVITIIVILILVAVIVNIAFKNGGIFTTTNNAAKSTTIAAEEEDLHNWCLGTYFDATSGTLDLASLSADKGFTETWKKTSNSSIIPWTSMVVENAKSKNQYTIESDGTVTPKKDESNDISILTDAFVGQKYSDSTDQPLTNNGISIYYMPFIEEGDAWYVVLYNGKYYDLLVNENTDGTYTVSGIIASSYIGDASNTFSIKNRDTNAKTVTITGIVVTSQAITGDGVLTIPATITGTDGVSYNVTKFDDQMGDQNLQNTVKSVVIEGSNLTTINGSAFNSCTNLTSITMTGIAKDTIPGAPWGATNATITYSN
jgi:Tfp pilus assembly protein PilE